MENSQHDKRNKTIYSLLKIYPLKQPPLSTHLPTTKGLSHGVNANTFNGVTILSSSSVSAPNQFNVAPVFTYKKLSFATLKLSHGRRKPRCGTAMLMNQFGGNGEIRRRIVPGFEAT